MKEQVNQLLFTMTTKENINENANDLANEGNNQEAIPPALANQDNQNQLNEEYH